MEADNVTPFKDTASRQILTPKEEKSLVQHIKNKNMCLQAMNKKRYWPYYGYPRHKAAQQQEWQKSRLEETVHTCKERIGK